MGSLVQFRHSTSDRLAEVAQQIEEQDALEAGQVTYQASVLCQVFLPARRIESNEYEIHSGPHHLSIQSPRTFGVPFGVYPRGILMWMAEQVVRRKKYAADSTTLDLGRSLSEFIATISRTTNVSGGKTGNLNRFRQQLNALVASRIFYYHGDVEQGIRFETMEVASSGTIFWSPKNENGEPALFQSQIVLGSRFYETLLKAAPLDRRIIHGLWPSCLAIDIYTWATYRAAVLQKVHRRTLSVPWVYLKNQFGTSYRDQRQFKREFLKALERVTFLYKGMRVREAGPGLDFELSQPSVRVLALPIKSTKD